MTYQTPRPPEPDEDPDRKGFAKVLGNGHEGGFGLRPSASRLGLFLLFEGQPLAWARVRQPRR